MYYKKEEGSIDFDEVEDLFELVSDVKVCMQ
jgi:hypothetical protein